MNRQQFSNVHLPVRLGCCLLLIPDPITVLNSLSPFAQTSESSITEPPVSSTSASITEPAVSSTSAVTGVAAALGCLPLFLATFHDCVEGVAWTLQASYQAYPKILKVNINYLYSGSCNIILYCVIIPFIQFLRSSSYFRELLLQYFIIFLKCSRPKE